MELKIVSSHEAIPNVNKISKLCTKENKLFAGGRFLRSAAMVIKTYYQEVFNKIVVKDYEKQRTIVFVEGSMSEEDQQKLKTFAEEMEVMNNKEVFDDEKENLEQKLKTTKLKEEGQMKVVKIFENWHEEFLVEWDEKHLRNIIDSIQLGEQEKMKLELGVYNFSEYEIEQKITEILRQSKKAVIPVDKGIESALSHFDKELFKYLTEYRRRVEKKQRIDSDQNDVRTWLEEAIEANDQDVNEHTKFYKGMLKNLDLSYSYIERESKCGGKNLKANELRKKLNFPNHVWNEADRSLGFILLPCEKMVEAEKEMAVKLGAELVNKTAEEIVQAVDDKAVEFERELNLDQVRVLEEFMPSRRISKKDVKLPFLKLNGKIQKLSKNEIEAKEIKKLSFRPVQDSISWSLNKYSYILMLFLRELNGEIFTKYPEVMQMVTISGHQFAEEMKDMKVNSGEYVAMTSSDMENAYVNIDLKDLKAAIEELCKEIECEAWKTELMIKLATLVLSNNYMEASIGIMKNGTNLPMGNCVSGEALDTVAINCEMKKRMNKSMNEVENLKSVQKLKR